MNPERNLTHIDDMNVFEPRESKILQDLAPKATGTTARESVLAPSCPKEAAYMTLRYRISSCLQYSLLETNSIFIFDIRSATSLAS